MLGATNTFDHKLIFCLIPPLPSMLFGGLLFWQQGFSLANTAVVVVLVIFSSLCGLLLWSVHSDELERRKRFNSKLNKESSNKVLAYAKELERMIILVSPKISEQVTAARQLTEQEIAVLIQRFTAMLAELEQIVEFVNRASVTKNQQDVENLRKNAELIRKEIDIVLEALQFQDRVSQILLLVEDNLSTLKKTAGFIQNKDDLREKDMIKVEEMLANIQSKYDTVNHLPKRSVSDHVPDELTFF